MAFRVMSPRGGMDQPEVEEVSGVLEIPLTGFVLRVRGSTVRMIGYVSRGDDPDAQIIDCTIIIHFPKFGFLRSWFHGSEVLDKGAEPGGMTMN